MLSVKLGPKACPASEEGLTQIAFEMLARSGCIRLAQALLEPLSHSRNINCTQSPLGSGRNVSCNL
jgi:hypothetical protein